MFHAEHFFHHRTLGAEEERRIPPPETFQRFKIAHSLGDHKIRRAERRKEFCAAVFQTHARGIIAGIDDPVSIQSGGGDFPAGHIVQHGITAHRHGDFFRIRFQQEPVEHGFPAVIHNVKNIFRLIHALFQFADRRRIQRFIQRSEDQPFRFFRRQVRVRAVINGVGTDHQPHARGKGVRQRRQFRLDPFIKLPRQCQRFILDLQKRIR